LNVLGMQQQLVQGAVLFCCWNGMGIIGMHAACMLTSRSGALL
jgi:hypothetical protein